MRTTVGALLIGLAVLLGSVPAAQAADYCIDIDNGAETLVLKSFNRPPKGRCADARGFYPGPAFVTGVACTSTSGVDLTLVLTTAFANNREIHHLDLALPGGSGTLRACRVDTGGVVGCSVGAVERIDCTPKVVPIP